MLIIYLFVDNFLFIIINMDDLYDRCYKKIDNTQINIKLENILLDSFNQDIYFNILKNLCLDAINLKNIIIKIFIGSNKFFECTYFKTVILDLIQNAKYNYVPLYLNVLYENINKIFGNCVQLENNVYYWPKIRHIYLNNNLSYIQEISTENEFIKMLTNNVESIQLNKINILYASILKYEHHFIYVLKNMVKNFEKQKKINILIENKLFFYNNTFLFFIKKLLHYKKIQIILNIGIKINFKNKQVTISNKPFTSLKKFNTTKKSQHKRKIYHY